LECVTIFIIVTYGLCAMDLDEYEDDDDDDNNDGE